MKKNIFSALFFIVLMVGIIIMFAHGNATDFVEGCFEELGLIDFSYDKIDELMKTYPFESKDSEIRIHCDGYDVITDTVGSTYVFRRIEVFSDKYEFGRERLGVGSSRDEVEKIVAKNSAIKGLDENSCGYIKDNLWIEFLFNNNTAEKVLLYYE